MMPENTLRNAARVCLIVLSLLLLGAIVWYRERMLFGDAAWIAFLIINKKSLLIQEHRYGSFITQIFPLAGTWLRLPLSGILLLYSASFNLFYLGVGVILYRWRQYRWLILHCCYLTLIVSVNYFWTNNEVHQGISWMMLLFGYVFYKAADKNRIWLQYILFSILAFLAIFSHPLVILVAGYLWVYLWISKQHPLLKDKRFIGYSIILCAITGLKYYISTMGWYDGGKMELVTHASWANINGALGSKTALDFMRACLLNYWMCTLFFAAGILQLIRSRSYITLLWVLISVTGYAIAICLINTGDPLQFHIESEWMGITILMTVPFVFQLLNIMPRRLTVILLLLTFCSRLVYIGCSAPIFTERLQVVQGIVNDMHQHQQSKVIFKRVEEHSPLEKSLFISWGLPVETLMLTIMNGDYPAVTAAYIPEPDLLQKLPKSKTDFLTTFFTIPAQEMNNDYFRYDTTAAYQVLGVR